MFAILLVSACLHRSTPPPRPPPPRLDVAARSAVMTALVAEDRGDPKTADERWAHALRIAPRDPGLIAAHYAAVHARNPEAASADLALLADLPTSDPETCWSVAAVIPEPDGARWLAVAVEARLDPAISLAATRALAASNPGEAERLWTAWRPASPEASFSRGEIGLALSRPAADDLVAGSLGIQRSDAEIAMVVKAVTAECRVQRARSAASRYPWTRLARALSAVAPCPGEL